MFLEGPPPTAVTITGNIVVPMFVEMKPRYGLGCAKADVICPKIDSLTKRRTG